MRASVDSRAVRTDPRDESSTLKPLPLPESGEEWSVNCDFVQKSGHRRWGLRFDTRTHNGRCAITIGSSRE
jgi:hypothetical protein